MRPTKTVILGATGLIGQELISFFRASGDDVVTAGRSSSSHIIIDLASRDIATPEEADRVILCSTANYQDPRSLTSAFSQGACRFVAALNRKGIPILFLSTNNVFDGTRIAPEPSDERHPVCDYGKDKVSIEDEVANGPQNTIVRLTKVIGPNFKLFETWAASLRDEQPIEAFDNLFFAPLRLNWTAAQLFRIANSGLSGIFQLSPSNELSYFEAAELIAKYLKVPKPLVRRVSATQTRHPRAFLHASLDTKLTNSTFGFTAPSSEEFIDWYCSANLGKEQQHLNCTQ